MEIPDRHNHQMAAHVYVACIAVADLARRHGAAWLHLNGKRNQRTSLSCRLSPAGPEAPRDMCARDRSPARPDSTCHLARGIIAAP